MLTLGHVHRHAPAGSNQGIEAAMIDIAQDVLLRGLHEHGVLELLAFKGGTALRKLYAGADGRFSTDLDFAVRGTDEDADAVLDLLVETIPRVAWGPFTFATRERRGKHYVVISSALGDVRTLSCKLDVSPPPWMRPERRGWIAMPVHARYEGPLPQLGVVRIEENMAEKIARLNRVTPARDVYDLVWIMTNRHRVGRELDLECTRRLAVLKAWVDVNGLTASKHIWKAAHEPKPLDLDRWLRERARHEFDDEDIGALTAPTPDLEDLGRALSRECDFLRELDDTERRLAACNGRDRTLALRLLAELPDSQLAEGSCW